MSSKSNLYRLSAFSSDPQGGNPAGVWLGATLPDDAEMQRIAAEVGFSETAFLAPESGSQRTVRYFSPLAEVPFCGHATIAAGVVLGMTEGPGSYLFSTRPGDVSVKVNSNDGAFIATLTSVDTHFRPAPPELLSAALAILNWQPTELDYSVPPAIAYAGAHHLIIATATLDRLNRLDYDFDALKALMLKHDLTTLQLIWQETEALVHARNPFPVGGVVEDAATGAAAAALGGYLRDSGLRNAPFQFNIRQGEAMGRPSQLNVRVPLKGGIDVSGTAVELE